jgi:hypothetical protein
MNYNRDALYVLALAFAADGADVQILQHAYRINGVMDIMKTKLTIYDVNNHKYHHFKEFEDMLPVIEDIIMNNPKREFKKTKKGNINYKEFMYNMNNVKKDAQ